MRMQEGNNITHPVYGEVLRISRENAAPVHIVWEHASEIPSSVKEKLNSPISVHMVSRGILAAAYLDITLATSTKST